jgi:hypothetical protein
MGFLFLLQLLNENFEIRKRLQQILLVFNIQAIFVWLRQNGHNLKIRIGDRSAGKPIVEQYEVAKQVAMDMYKHTKLIIVFRFYNSRRMKGRKQFNLKIKQFNSLYCVSFLCVPLVISNESDLQSVITEDYHSN